MTGLDGDTHQFDRLFKFCHSSSMHLFQSNKLAKEIETILDNVNFEKSQNNKNRIYDIHLTLLRLSDFFLKGSNEKLNKALPALMKIATNYIEEISDDNEKKKYFEYKTKCQEIINERFKVPFSEEIKDVESIIRDCFIKKLNILDEGKVNNLISEFKNHYEKSFYADSCLDIGKLLESIMTGIAKKYPKCFPDYNPKNLSCGYIIDHAHKNGMIDDENGKYATAILHIRNNLAHSDSKGSSKKEDFDVKKIKQCLLNFLSILKNLELTLQE